ncbi:PREDICTED: uncharacterized protein LOC106325431 isoform X2 [Brassica oleracea var. oleracea]|uniref:uncharacterized protein LOC106325431 isoform X2 n=1 Tax=Brassica oleracea var. oleracea TaxID=109376 RepID=UPI0006A70840|nr:PREDICTED: uncharacterized protein LOC106325431 isoform X2 [Brassica oleracea var. oleracea]
MDIKKTKAPSSSSSPSSFDHLFGPRGSAASASSASSCSTILDSIFPPPMREAVMKEEKLRISAHPSTTEASNTIHLHELMMPPPLLHHIITPKKLMIALTQPPLLPEEIGGKVPCITKTNL